MDFEGGGKGKTPISLLLYEKKEGERGKKGGRAQAFHSSKGPYKEKKKKNRSSLILSLLLAKKGGKGGKKRGLPALQYS